MNGGQARLQALLAAILFSTGGAGIKLAAFTGLQVSSIRSGIAALALLLWLRGALHWSWTAVAVGSIYACTLTLFVLATKLTTAANAIFLQSTAPLYILVLGPFLIGESFRRRDIGYVAATAVGMIFCFAGRPDATTTAPDPAAGNLLAVICSVTWALTLLALRRVERDGPQPGLALTAVVVGNVIACLVAFPFGWPFPSATISEWATLVYLGVFQIGLAYVFLTRAMRLLAALDVSLLLLVEPVLNPLWTWLVRGEQPGGWVVVGGATIIAATAFRGR